MSFPGGLHRGVRGGAAVSVALLVAAASVPAAAYPRPGRTERVSVATDGTQGNLFSGFTSVSADGRYVAFSSSASNLVPDDTNGVGDVFVRDRDTGTTERVSVANDGAQGNGYAHRPSISADGRSVVFDSGASNLVAGDTNGVADVFVRDLVAETTERLSVSTDGTESNGHSFNPSVSPDGRFVAFESLASNLVPGDTNGSRDIFVHDRETGITERVSVATDGTEGDNNSWTPSISADGRLVAFASDASNLVPGDTNGSRDIFVRDREAGTTRRVSVATDGTEANGHSYWPSISADGRFVSFSTPASNLVPTDTNGINDVFVRDVESGVTERVSVHSDGTEKGGFSPDPSISADGRYVAFQSATAPINAYVRDRETGTTERVSVGVDGAEGNAWSGWPAISLDGRWVVFESDASNLVPDDTNDERDAFLRDRGPAIGVGDVSASPDGERVSVTGWATFSGQVVAAASDPPDDGAAGAEEAGGELTGASLVYRHEQEDLLVRFQLAWLPGERCVTVTLDAVRVTVDVVCERGGGAGGVLAPGLAHRRVVYTLGFELEGATYEVRARTGSTVRTPAGAETDDPHLALYRCDPGCTEQAPLAGGIGTTGTEVVVTVPLAALGAAAGTALTQIRASTSTEAGAVDPQETLDEADLPDATIPTAQVMIGVAPASTPEPEVLYTTRAELAEGHFSATLDAASLSAGNHLVWARACLGEVCGARWVVVTN